MLPLLIDSDAFTKLALAGILDDVLSLLGSDRAHCARLAALPHMLRRGRLRNNLGPDIADALIPLASSLPTLDEPGAEWLDRFAQVPAIDPGEAQLLALAAERRILLITADKRALAALKSVSGVAESLNGQLVVLEAVLLALCQTRGADEIRARVAPLKMHDKMVQIAFSDATRQPEEALSSYFRALADDCSPIALWKYGNGAPGT